MFYYLWYSTVGSSLKLSHLLLFVAPCSMSSYIKNDIIMFYYLWCSTVESSLKPSHLLLFVAPCSMSSCINNEICSFTYGTPLLGPVWNLPIFYFLLHLVPCLVTLRMIYVLLLMVLHCWVQFETFPSSTFCCTFFHV